MSMYLNERSRRIWAATEAQALGKGGRAIVHEATGIAYKTIHVGHLELEKPEEEQVKMERIRKEGGGRKKKTAKNPELKKELERIVEPSTVGDPERPLKWISKSLRNIEAELNKEKKRVSHMLIKRELQELGYSLQGNKKTKEGSDHPDRNEQFEFINKKTIEFLAKGDPVISVDTKKKENIGNYKNGGQEYAPKGKPLEVNGHDFPNKELGKAVPYGILDIDRNKGWVNVGISADTAEFAVESIRRWWSKMGAVSRPQAKKLYINADGGGSNGSRNRLWKREIQKLANETGLEIHVSHFPPGTSKWNKIEHRMFCFISKNWRGKPLIDRATVVNLIASTTTKKGLEIQACLDENTYETKIKVSDEEMAFLNLRFEDFHGNWNYILLPEN